MRRLGWCAVFAAVAGGASIAGASCAVPGFERVDTGGATSTTAGGAGGQGGDGGAGACGSVRPPNPPSSATPGGTIEFVAALRTLSFGEAHEDAVGPAVGYDLDKECTCFPEGEASCAPPGNAPVDCDGPGGRDSAVSRLFKQLNLFEPETFSSEYHTERAEMGAWSLLIRVLGYNGEPDDEQVELVIYPSPGLDANPCLPAQPAWDGTDAWPVDSIALVPQGGQGGAGGAGGAGGGSCDSAPGFDLDDPLYRSSVAYVSGGVLVAQLPDSALVLSSSSANTAINLVGGFLTARIVSLPEGYALEDGVLAGRWRLADFFAVVGTISTMGLPICTNHPLYDPIKGVVCNYPDITAQAAATPATPCDSLSFGMGFTAFPATLGIVVVGPPPNVNMCPMSVDPAGDSCAR